MVWKMIMLAIVLGNVQETEKPVGEPIEIRILDEQDEMVKDLKLDVFEDAECTKVCKDDKGKPLCIEAEKDGIYRFEAERSVYIRSQPVTGRYPVIASIPKGSSGGTLVQNAMTIETEVVLPEGEEEWKDLTFQIREEDGKISAAWKKDDPFPIEKLEAGKTYSIVLEKEIPYCVVRDGQLILPKTKPQEDLKKMIELAWTGRWIPESNEETGSMYGLYAEEECKKAAADVHGEEVRFKAGEKKEYLLYPGTYWLKQEEIPDSFYQWTGAREIVIQEKEERKEDIKEEAVVMHLSADTDCSVHVRRKDTEEVLDLKADEDVLLPGHRKETITLEADPKPGFFPIPPLTFTYAETLPQEATIKLQAHPFTVRVSLVQEGSETYIAGGTIAVRDEEGNEVMRLQSDSEPVPAEGLLAGGVYTFTLEGIAGQYVPAGFARIHIPKWYSEESGDDFAAEIRCLPFTHVYAGSMEGQLYLEEECVRKASDLYGKNAWLSKAGIALLPGSYWWKCDQVPEGYYPIHGTIRIDVNGEAEKIVQADAEPIRLSVLVKESGTEQLLSGGLVQLLDEAGEKILAQAVPANGEVLFQEDVLRYGKTYTVRQAMSAPMHLRDSEDIRVVIPDQKEDLQVVLHDRHYSTLTMRIDTDGRKAEESWTVYEADGKPAYDIYGNPAELRFQDREEASLQIVDGSYVIMQDTCTPGLYPDAEGISLTIANEDVYEIQRYHTATALFVTSKTEDGDAVKDALLQAVGRDETVYDTWTTIETDHRIDGIPAGETVTIRIKEAPSGYSAAPVEIQIPLEKPQECPAVSVVWKKDPVKQLLPKHIAEEDVPPTLPWGILTGAGSLVLMGIRLVLKKVHHI